MSSERERDEEERWLDSEVWTARSPDGPKLEVSAAADGGAEAEDGPAPAREEPEGDGAAEADPGKAAGGDPSLRDVYELLRSCATRFEGARKEDEDRLTGETKKLSGIAGKLTELGEEIGSLPAKMTGGGAQDGTAWRTAAERFEEAIRAHSEDFGAWIKGERRRRRRLPALALAVAAPGLPGARRPATGAVRAHRSPRPQQRVAGMDLATPRAGHRGLRGTGRGRPASR